MSGLLLHQVQVSPFAAKVRRALRYKDIEFNVKNYSVMQLKEVRKNINPTGKIPVLEHNGAMIVDSTSIIAYLDENFAGPRLYPDNPVEKAMSLIIEDWADESLYFYDVAMRGWPNNVDWLLRDVLIDDTGFSKWLLTHTLPGAVKKLGDSQGIGRKEPMTVCREVEVHFDSIVALLSEGDWLVGQSMSVADISVAAMCTVIERAEEAAHLMQERPVLLGWRERVDAATFPPGTSPEDRAFL